MAVYTTGLVAEFVGAYATGSGPNDNGNAGTRTTWVDLAAAYDATADGSWSTWDTSTGWAGAGTAGDPYCIVVDGNRYFTLPDMSVAEDKTFTYEAWVSNTQTGVTAWAFSEAQPGSATGACVGLGLAPPEARGCMWNDVNASGNSLATWSWDGSWTHSVYTGDGTSGRVYVNNTLLAGPTTLPSGAVTLSNACISGRNRGGWNYGWIGKIATVRVYSGNIGATQVGNNYAAGTLGVGSSIGSAFAGITVIRDVHA